MLLVYIYIYIYILYLMYFFSLFFFFKFYFILESQLGVCYLTNLKKCCQGSGATSDDGKTVTVGSISVQTSLHKTNDGMIYHNYVHSIEHCYQATSFKDTFMNYQAFNFIYI